VTLFDALLLGLIQGLTGFIPVSSTAHLLIGQRLLGLPADDAMFSFLVIVQLGTIVSLFVLYWKDLISIAQAVLDFRTPTPGRDLGFFILAATVPALIAGYLLRDAVESLFRQPMLEAAIRLLTAAALMALAELVTRKNRPLSAMTWLDALFIGLMQIVSIFPGASRSATTISGGMFRGLDRPSAARFAFLMSVPVMLAAGGYEMLDVVRMPDVAEFLPLLVAGFISAAVFGWLSVKWLIDYLGKRSLYPFAAYCALVGLIMLFVQVF
jgi:undecaprenyl-diphosphatase